MNKIYLKSIFFLLISLTISSCGPVHRFTRVKKIPREYSLNYCGGEIKAPKTDINKNPWIIFSDREKNMTFNNPGGKVKAKDIDYLDPFLVIKKKGEYLRVIKYTPDILKNGKLDYKKAEYYGWIHKSKVLLNQQSVTDIASGKKNKMLVMFSDTISINQPDKYFGQDSVKVHKDLRLETVSGSIAPYSVVYQMKQSEKGNMTLISKKPIIKPDEIGDEILGWVDNSLVKNIGTGLHVNTSTIPYDSTFYLISRKGQVIPYNEDLKDIGGYLADQHKTIKFNPVSSYCVLGKQVAYRTRMTIPIFDYSNNYIFNVNGGHISHRQFRKIAKGLKKINITFVFEGKEQTIAQFPQIVNALQNLQPLFEKSDDSFSYQFSCVMTFDNSNKIFRAAGTELHPDYSQTINYLSDKANNKDKLRSLKLARTWMGLRTAVNAFDNHRDATNLIVLIGETAYAMESVDEALQDKLKKNNCRILGFQVYSKDDNSSNNFVLDIESMIRSYSDNMINTKGDILVSPSQVKRTNSYKEMPDTRNCYRLDFPDRSMTQGVLLFPPKEEYLPMDVLSTNIDTILQQIRYDNDDVISHMSQAFSQVGNNRTKYDSLFMRNFSLDTTRIPEKKMVTGFKSNSPGWYLPSQTIVLADSVNNKVDYHMMLSESEMTDLKEFVESLSAIEVDYKYQADAKKKAKRKPCDCPDDDLFLELDVNVINGKGVTPEYAKTGKVRKNLYKQYLRTIKHCKLCKEKGGKLKKMTFAEAQRRIIGIPTANETLNYLRIKDIKKKKIVSDKMLDDLINYFKAKREELEKAEKFESNGETYYWVEKKLLP